MSDVMWASYWFAVILILMLILCSFHIFLQLHKCITSKSQQMFVSLMCDKQVWHH